MPLKQKNISRKKIYIAIAVLVIIALAVISFAPVPQMAEVVLFP